MGTIPEAAEDNRCLWRQLQGTLEVTILPLVTPTTTTAQLTPATTMVLIRLDSMDATLAEIGTPVRPQQKPVGLPSAANP
jgi:hypothetical protein